MASSDGCALRLIRLARLALADATENKADGQQHRQPGDVLVNVTVYVRQHLRASMSGSGPTAEDAVREAATRAARDARFGEPLAAEDLADARLELWIHTGSDVIDSGTVTTDLDLGFHGVEIRSDSRSAYYKPSVALTSALPKHDALLDKLTVKARLPPGSWREPGITLKRTTWEHYCEVPADPDRVLHLRRLRPAGLSELTPKALSEGARLAADRLMNVQGGDGYYLYKFHPFSGRQTPGPGNLVRQAGCAYAMARAADSAAEPGRRDVLAASAGKAADALLRRVVLELGRVFVIDLSRPRAPVHGKLGTLALTLATLQRRSMDERYRPERQQLTEGILSWQRPDGSFQCRTDSTSVAADGTGQDYFPGEALLALSAELRAGSKDARRAMAAALPWYRARFRAHPTTAFVPWQIEAWRQYADWAMGVEGPLTLGAAEPSEFVFEMADWILRLQIGPETGRHPDLTGGYIRSDGKPDCSTATYTEAVIGAFALAQRVGDTERAHRYRLAALLGLQFAHRLQIAPDTAVLFQDPVRVVGGTTSSLSNMTLRCDHGQHALTAYLAALETNGLL